MNKLELTSAFEQLARGFPQAAKDLADHFMPDSQTIEVAVPTPAPAPDAYLPTFPSAEAVEAAKAAGV